MSNIGGSGDKNPIIETPENWDEMVKKYNEREDEAKRKAMEKRDAQTLEDLKNISKKAIDTRAQRAGTPKAPSDSPIIKNPTNEEVLKKRNELDQELDAFAKHVMKQFPNLSSEIDLKGRVKPQNPGTAA